MSLGAGAYKVGGAGQCFSMRRRYPWKPFGQPPPGTVTLNKSESNHFANNCKQATAPARGIGPPPA